MGNTALTLISHPICPYVQRATITLLEKGVPFERRYVDLAEKPDWFLTMSPLGKVPLLVIGQEDGSEAVLFESAVICEYLEETQPGAPLHPADPLTRARHRGWIEFSSTILMDLWGFQTAADAEGFEAKRQVLIDKFRRVEAALGDGPFFAGAGFSLVDAAYAPIFGYFDLFDTIAPTGIFEGLSYVPAWRQALSGRASVRDAVPEDFADRLKTIVHANAGWLIKRAA